MSTAVGRSASGEQRGAVRECPRCRAALPENAGVATCPKCGLALRDTAATVDVTSKDLPGDSSTGETTYVQRGAQAPSPVRSAEAAEPQAAPPPASADKSSEPETSGDSDSGPPRSKSTGTFKAMVSLVRGIRRTGTHEWNQASQKPKERSGSSSGSSGKTPADGSDEESYRPTAGEIIGNFRLVMPVGRGSFGDVWKGTHLKSNLDVAVKFLSEKREQEHSTYRARFLREARAARRVRHPNLIAVLDAGTHQGRPYMVQEYVSGDSLGAILKREGPLPEATVLQVAQSVGEALQAAHREGIIHRDIKPENILQSADGPIKLIDLGLAKDRGQTQESSLTAPETALGTPRYMAPEQARDARFANERSDLYGLGATLYHLATGQLPFKGGMIEIILAHATEPLVPPRTVRPELSEGFSRLVCHLMAKRPEHRVQNADELLDKVRRVRWGLSLPECPQADEPFLGDSSDTAARPSGARAPVFRLPSRLMLIITALAVAAAVGAWLWHHFNR